jgi:predicted ThiF/HesA family dinucleotide-utilizing enzyme
MSMAGGDITVEILKEIRDEIRNVRGEVQELRVDTNGRFDEVREEIHAFRTETAERFGVVETALLDLAEQDRFLVRSSRATAQHESRLEPRVNALESRVDKLESK